MKSRTILFISIIVVLVVGTAGYYGFSSSAQQPTTPEAPQTVAVTKCDVQQTVTAPGKLDNTSETLILMPANGTLSEVLVNTGDSVTAGQVLGKLDDTLKAQAQIDLKDAERAYQSAYNYRLSLNGERWLKQETYKYDRGRQITVTKWYKGYVDAETIKKADNNLALKKAELDDAQAVVDQMELKAPFSGVVTEVDAVVDLPKMAGDTLFKMIDPKALEIVANVTEEDYPLLSVGQAAEIFFDARPDVTVQGKVSRISPLRIEGEDTPLYNIYITLDEVPDGLADGMTADTAITIAKVEGALCLPRAVVRASSTDTTIVKVWDGVQEETEREVTVGLRGDTYVEIISGLEEGEQVVTR